MSTNKNLRKAKNAKNDEFYTQLTDIEKELVHYKKHFKNKIIYCNCDNPLQSKFWEYFHTNFEKIELKRLIATYYDNFNITYKLVYDGGNDNNIKTYIKIQLKGNGDFRSEECVNILKESDIIVTNPPFSLFREFVAQLIKYNKKFLIVGNKNTVNCNEFFHLLKENKLWFGYEHPQEFDTPNGKTKKVQGLCRWFTNLDIEKRHEILKLHKQYIPKEYPTYDNYNAININKICDIPYDYDGIMGVPITFFDKYNPEQFEILGRSGDIKWALTCGFFTPPSEEKQQQYKKYYKNWRVQNSYLLDTNNMPVCIYYRVFIKHKNNHL